MKCLNGCVDKALKLKRKHKRKKKPTKPWYNDLCKSKKKQLKYLTGTLPKKPKDLCIIAQFQ